MPVAFALPSPTSPAAVSKTDDDVSSEAGDYRPSGHASSAPCAVGKRGSATTNLPVSVVTPTRAHDMTPEGPEARVCPSGSGDVGATTTNSFSFEDGEVAGVLRASCPSTAEASPHEQGGPRSNTVLSECSIVDHAAPSATGAALSVPPALAHPTTASYASAVESVAVHRLTVKELLRRPPPADDASDRSAFTPVDI